jgi:hypothetical protein
MGRRAPRPRGGSTYHTPASPGQSRWVLALLRGIYLAALHLVLFRARFPLVVQLWRGHPGCSSGTAGRQTCKRSSCPAWAQAMASHIDVGASLSSGEVTTVDNRQQVSHAELSQTQLQGLLHWLKVHRNGWYTVNTPAAPLPPSYLSLDFKYSDGKTTSISTLFEGTAV